MQRERQIEVINKQYLTKINSTRVDNENNLDVVMSMYNLIEYGNDYSKTSESLYQFCR